MVTCLAPQLTDPRGCLASFTLKAYDSGLTVLERGRLWLAVGRCTVSLVAAERRYWEAQADDVDALLQERCEEYGHEELHFAGWHIDSDGHFQPDDSDDEGGLNWDW